jgi:tetratricopeptide (TPR) repeat protein
LWNAVGQPFAPFLLLGVGNSLWQRGETSRALSYWQLVPDLDVYFALHGRASEMTGDSVTALSDYQISWMINDRGLPIKGNALISFCELLRRRGEISQAIKTCERAHESGNTFWSNMVLGMLYSDQRDFMTAETYFRQAQAENPDDARANLWTGLSLANQGKLSQAMPFYQQGLALSPNDGWLNYLMGKALWNSGLRNDARGYFEKSVQFVPDSWEAAYLEDALGLLSGLHP